VRQYHPPRGQVVLPAECDTVRSLACRSGNGCSTGGGDRNPTLRTRLSLESLDGRVVPSGNPTDPPASPPPQTPTSDPAYAIYLAEESAARADFNSAVSAANQQLLTTVDQLVTTAEAAAAPIVAAANTAADAAWADFLATHDATYAAFSAAWDAAGNDPAARQAAVQAYNATMAAASAQVVQTINGIDAAAIAQVNAIGSQLDAMVATAANSWLATVEAARTQYDSQEQAAWDAYMADGVSPAEQIAFAQMGGQPVQQQQKGPRQKDTTPFIQLFPDRLKPIKIVTDPVTKKTKIEIPAIVRIDFRQAILPLPLQLDVGAGAQYDPAPKPGKPSVSGNIPLLNLSVKW
jgi:hypothetical protein